MNFEVMSDKFFYLLIYGFASVASATSILERYAKIPGSVYHGRYTRDVHEPEFLVPRHVNEDGDFRTYALPRYYDRREINDRIKRESPKSERDELHLLLTFDGVEHHVELTPYHGFISPDMVIETRGPGIDKIPNEGLRFSKVPNQQCHYRGRVRGHSNSRAALSLCDGVVGYIQTNAGRYFIEPVSEAEPTSDGQHVHIAYRREAPHEKSENGSLAGSGPKRHCGTGDNWEAAWAEQLAKRQQRLVDGAEFESNDDNAFVELSKRAGNKPVSSGTHSIHRFIEIGVICDKQFLDYHKGTDYEKYMLTIMNMVSDYYHDASSGNQIDVVVVRMIYLEMEKKEIDLSISPDADKTLASFAAWAEKMNPKDHKHPNHFDIAVLITRHDICLDSCDLMGLAYVAAACDSAKAACINEDSGLLLGIVVAHEVGHVMGCSHDEVEASGCPPQDKDDSYFLMSPIVFIYTIRWSTCSRKFITSFLESGLGECLNDDPRNPSDKYSYPKMLPGAMYDASAQCNFDKPGAILCPRGAGSICEQLWCKAGERCYSKGAPPAEGTKCGEKKWCIRKKCVDMGSRPKAVNGGWGAWGPLSSCSRTCGAGIKTAERECNKPMPSNGGRYCIGERRKMSTCNTTPCDPNKPPFRALQCAEFNTKPVTADNLLHKWVPFLRDDLEPCALYCMNEQNSFIKLSPTANDSTPCKGGTYNMCLSGSCRKVGCDWVIDSDAVDDQCGVCKGDGTQCSPVEGQFTKTNLGDYQKVVMVPKGARSIHVVEKKPAENTLAVKTEKGSKYCLNGNHVEQRNGDYPCAGALLIYSHPEPQKEEITIRGPISEDIQIQYTFFNPTINPGVQYKYYVKTGGAPGYKPKYIWDFTEWGECSAKCGGGTMISDPSCIEEQNGLVSPSFCQGTPRPEPKSRICNEKPCPTKWRVSQWSGCSACNGKTGTKHRKVQCMKPAARPGGDDIQTDLKACRGRVPKQKEKCVGKRPCKKTCKNKRHDCDDTEEKFVDPQERERLLNEQRRMIDEFVDIGLTRYLDKNRRQGDGKSSRFANKREVSDDFRNLLRDWVMMGNHDEKNKRTCKNDPRHKPAPLPIGRNLGPQQAAAITQSPNDESQLLADKKFTTPKAGSIIRDVVPTKEIVVYEAPFKDEQLTANISDIAFQEGGDIIPGGLDTQREKVYYGAQAVSVLAGNENPKDDKVDQTGSTSTTTIDITTVNVTEGSRRRSNGKSASDETNPKIHNLRFE